MTQHSLEAVLKQATPLIDRIGGIITGVNELPRASDAPRLYQYGTDASRMAPLPGDPDPNDHVLLPQVPGAGVSLDRVEAQVRALGEGVERYCMCVYSPDQFVRATAEELGEQALDLDTLARCAPIELSMQKGAVAAPRKDVPLRWIKGISLVDGEPRYVPGVMVYLHFPPQHREESIWIPISTGCAFHVDPKRALISAICEMIERDSLMLTWLHQLPLPRIDLGPEELWPSQLQTLMRLARESHLDYHFFDATSDLGIPSIYALQFNDHSDLLANLVVSATRLDPFQAVIRILEEGCTSRVALDTHLAASPPNPVHREHPEQIFKLEDCALYYAQRDMRHHFDFLMQTPTTRHIRDIANRSTGSVDGDLALLIDTFRDREMDVVAVDITTPDVRAAGFWVMRVVIPQLIPLSPAYAIRFLDTPRLYDAPLAMGYGKRTIDDITPKPQPFA